MSKSDHSTNLSIRVAPILSSLGGNNARNFEPKTRLKFEDLDKSIQKLRDIYKIHPEWFEVPKPKSDKGRNVVDYSI
jgi:hypothetical protein